MPDFVAILENDPDRIDAMRSCMAGLLPRCTLHFFDNSGEMTTFLTQHLSEVVLISLDHDLPLQQRRGNQMVDPGTGRAVADFLSRLLPTCPVIVHSSNDAAALGMMRVLQDAAWPCARVFPFDGHTWVALAWADLIRKQIRAGWIFDATTPDR